MANYLNIPAVGQIDPTLCWAASMKWWLKAVWKVSIKQSKLRDRHYMIWDDDGTMSDTAIQSLINDARYGMKLHTYSTASSLTIADLQTHLSKSPVYIAYTETSSMKKHVNVLYEVVGSGATARVAAMEPQSSAIPDDTGNDSGVYIGKHETKFLSDFNSFGSIYLGVKK